MDIIKLGDILDLLAYCNAGNNVLNLNCCLVTAQESRGQYRVFKKILSFDLASVTCLIISIPRQSFFLC